MPQRQTRSLRHEYELFVEREIEDYKDSLPRSVLLSIGDEAVARLSRQSQMALTELVLCDEVDRIIRSRLRLPTYQTWRRRRIRELDEMKRPERWGLRPDDALVRAVRPNGESHVLIAGARAKGAALYLAALGCDVMAVERDAIDAQRVVEAAEAAGLSQRVRAWVADLAAWTSSAEAHRQQLAAVVCSSEALECLTPVERARVIRELQAATTDGGVHLVETAGSPEHDPVDELRRQYTGWVISVENAYGPENTFLARKNVA